MKQIQSFNRTTCREVETEITEAIKTIEEKFNVMISRKTGRFSPECLTLTFEINLKAESGKPKLSSLDLSMLEIETGLSADQIANSNFVDRASGRIFTVIGYNHRANLRPMKFNFFLSRTESFYIFQQSADLVFPPFAKCFVSSILPFIIFLHSCNWKV